MPGQPLILPAPSASESRLLLFLPLRRLQREEEERLLQPGGGQEEEALRLRQPGREEEREGTTRRLRKPNQADPVEEEAASGDATRRPRCCRPSSAPRGSISVWSSPWSCTPLWTYGGRPRG